MLAPCHLIDSHNLRAVSVRTERVSVFARMAQKPNPSFNHAANEQAFVLHTCVDTVGVSGAGGRKASPGVPECDVYYFSTVGEEMLISTSLPAVTKAVGDAYTSAGIQPPLF